MPTTTVPGVILDSRGQPMSPAAGYGAGFAGRKWQRTEADDRLRPRPPNHFADELALVTTANYQRLVSESRAAAAHGFLSALIDNKTGYISASHFLPRFQGTDSAYGRAATTALRDALKICNLRGNRYDWAASWRLAPRQFAESGGFFVLLTKWPGTGQPALQFLEAHRIGQRPASTNLVSPTDALTTIVAADGSTSDIRGAYSGLFIHGGIITNAQGTELAYRVLGATADDDRDISARDLIHVASPKSYSENRPVPAAAAGLLDFLALQLAQTCQLDQHIGDARRDVVEKTVTGRADPGAELTGMALTPAGTPTEVIERGMIRFIKTGNDITPFQSARPSDQWTKFDERVAARAAAALGWRAEMLDPSALRGGSTRAFQDQINTLWKHDFYSLEPAISRCLRYFVACLTQLGELPPHPEALLWSVSTPPDFEVDRASARIDLEEVGAGRVAMSTLHARDGRTSADVYSERAHDYLLAAQIAKETGVNIEVILGTNGPAKNALPADAAAVENSTSTPPANPKPGPASTTTAP